MLIFNRHNKSLKTIKFLICIICCSVAQNLFTLVESIKIDGDNLHDLINIVFSFDHRHVDPIEIRYALIEIRTTFDKLIKASGSITSKEQCDLETYAIELDYKSSRARANINRYLIHHRRQNSLRCVSMYSSELNNALKSIAPIERTWINAIKDATYENQKEIKPTEKNFQINLYQTDILQVSLVDALVEFLNEFLDAIKSRPQREVTFKKYLQNTIGHVCYKIVSHVNPLIRRIFNSLHKDDYEFLSNYMDKQMLNWIANTMVCRAYHKDNARLKERVYADYKKRYPTRTQRFLNALYSCTYLYHDEDED